MQHFHMLGTKWIYYWGSFILVPKDLLVIEIIYDTAYICPRLVLFQIEKYISHILPIAINHSLKWDMYKQIKFFRINNSLSFTTSSLISNSIKDRRNPLAYPQKLLWVNWRIKKTPQKWIKNKPIVFCSNNYFPINLHKKLIL